jgi:hypothetical protein
LKKNSLLKELSLVKIVQQPLRAMLEVLFFMEKTMQQVKL